MARKTSKPAFDSEDRAEDQNALDTAAALGALIMLLSRVQRRLWRTAKDDLRRRLNDDNLAPSQYAAVIERWAALWGNQFQVAGDQVYKAVEPAIGRLSRVIASQVDRQLKNAGYQTVQPLELPSVTRKVRQTTNAVSEELVAQVRRQTDTTVSLVKQAALAELPVSSLRKSLDNIEPAKRGPQLTAREAEGALVFALQHAAFRAAGVEKARWVTRRDNRVRPTHQVRDGKIYDVDKGLGGIFPGQEVNCRCVAVPVPR